MAHRTGTKTTFEASRVIRPIYTGGSVALSKNGRLLASCLGEQVSLTELENGVHLALIEGDGEPVTTLALTPDGSHLIVCSRSLSMRIYAIEPSSQVDSVLEARLLRTVKPHSTPAVTAAVDSTGSLLATGGADGEVKVWDIRAGYVTHTFHGHSGVISALHFFQVDPDNEAGPTKSKKRKSRQRDEETEATEDAATAGFRLASGGEDGRIRIWNLNTRKGLATLDSHVSVVRSLDYSSELNLLLSGSRDKTAILWDPKTWQVASTVAVLETIERAGFLEHGRFFFTAGESARLRVWTTLSGQEVTEEQASGNETDAILDVLYHPELSFVLSVHADQTLILHSLSPLRSETKSLQHIQPLPITSRISGTHDEVIDLAYVGRKRNMLALATNLESLRIISIAEPAIPGQATENSQQYFGADVGLLKDHADIIITIDTDWSGHWLATGAKDNTAKLWRLDPENTSFTCYATFTGHAESIGAVALPNARAQIGSKEYDNPLDYPPKFLITGSLDKTIKRWDIAKRSRAAYTRKAHDKDINAIETSFSSDSPLFASASQDRTVKIWDVETGESIGVLRGHKRGVWTVAFSPPNMPALTTTGEGGAASTARGMVVTGSGDKTVRIWSLNDYSCLRTFEGHVNSVLKVVWLPPPSKSGSERKGVQVASAAGDGLVKVWDAQSGECAATLDNHIDRVWALAIKPEPILSAEERQKVEADAVAAENGDNPGNLGGTLEIVSGSADSTLTFWSDTTAITALQATTQATARIEQDQELQNYIRSNDYREAIVLALQLNHPKRLLEIFTSVISSEPDEGSLTGQVKVDQVLRSLSDSHLWSLLQRVRDWNANGRTHHVAQRILHAILCLFPKDRLLNLQRRRKTAVMTDADNDLASAMNELSTKDRATRKESVKDVIDGLKAYTERHYTRLEKTAEERFVLMWALQQMDDVSGETNGFANGLLNGHAEDDVLMLDED